MHKAMVRQTQNGDEPMEHSERGRLMAHLLEWCRTQERSEDEACALRDRIASWCDREGEWGHAADHGWPWALRHVEEYEEYNRGLRERLRQRPFRV